jgi:hypothetical protein
MDLRVDEALARHPFLDPGQPGDRHPVQGEPVLDQRADAHLDRPRRHDAEVQPGRRDRLEVAGVGEELEDGAGGCGQPLLAAQDVDGGHVHRIRSSVGT